MWFICGPISPARAAVHAGMQSCGLTRAAPGRFNRAGSGTHHLQDVNGRDEAGQEAIEQALVDVALATRRCHPGAIQLRARRLRAQQALEPLLSQTPASVPISACRKGEARGVGPALAAAGRRSSSSGWPLPRLLAGCTGRCAHQLVTGACLCRRVQLQGSGIKVFQTGGICLTKCRKVFPAHQLMTEQAAMRAPGPAAHRCAGEYWYERTGGVI